MSSTLKDALLKLGIGGHEDYVFVNALVIGARKLVGDEKMFPTRDKTVYVEGETTDVALRMGDWVLAYVISRRGSRYTLLGRSQKVGNWYAV